MKENYIQLIYRLSDHSPIELDKHTRWHFGITFYKDVIEFIGPFDHFSSWWLVCENENLAKGWSNVVQAIYTFLGVEKVIYFTEWGFLYKEAEGYGELDEWTKTKPENLANDLRELVDFDKIHVQTLN
jgi:hypothetical protein